MKKILARIPVSVKILIVIFVILFILFHTYFFLFELYRFPRDSLANYPGTHWKCDKLEMEFFVDESGKISGICEVDSDLIVLDATAHASTTYHSNYIECINRADSTQRIYLHCFYKKIQDGVFYVIADSAEATLDLNVITDYIPYKFEKQ